MPDDTSAKIPIDKAPKTIGPLDPVDSETLKRLEEIRDARVRIGGQLLDMETKKVQLLVAARQLDVEEQRYFEKILIDRGLPPNTSIEIDTDTGVLSPL